MLLCPVAAGDRANPEAGFSRPLLIATGHRVSPLVVVSKTPLPALCPRLRPCEGEGHRTGGEVQNVQQTTTRGEAHEQHGSSRSVSNIRKGSGIRREAGFKRRRSHMNIVALATVLFMLKLVLQCIREDLWPIEEPDHKHGEPK